MGRFATEILARCIRWSPDRHERGMDQPCS
jgi:hypothetical protein